MLLSPKKLLAFLRGIALILAIFSFIYLNFRPLPVNAGFFSNFLKIFGNDTDAVIVKETRAAAISMPLLSSQNSPLPEGDDSQNLITVTQDSSLVSSLNPLGTLQNNPNSDRIFIYKVQEGDTPSSIAKSFGISVNTILWANNLKRPNLINVGDELVILPVSGVKYTVKKGDTIESISKKFKVESGEIMEFNGLAIDDQLAVGDEIIIPDGELASPPSESSGGGGLIKRFAALPEFVGYYLRPILGGRNSRATANNPHGLHENNGVDLAAPCGEPVFASAPGQVIVSRYLSYPTRYGYGNYIVINHPNGTQTLYAHLQNTLAFVGQTVSQGQIIGLIGRTGNSTGCHVHFEIRGAKNPF
jgi:murein DD-endopeptidase MepM/ murein hydrolase activator NlpD